MTTAYIKNPENVMRVADIVKEFLQPTPYGHRTIPDRIICVESKDAKKYKLIAVLFNEKPDDIRLTAILNGPPLEIPAEELVALIQERLNTEAELDDTLYQLGDYDEFFEI